MITAIENFRLMLNTQERQREYVILGVKLFIDCVGMGSYEPGAVVLDWIKRIGLDKANRMKTVAYRDI